MIERIEVYYTSMDRTVSRTLRPFDEGSFDYTGEAEGQSAASVANGLCIGGYVSLRACHSGAWLKAEHLQRGYNGTGVNGYGNAGGRVLGYLLHCLSRHSATLSRFLSNCVLVILCLHEGGTLLPYDVC